MPQKVLPLIIQMAWNYRIHVVEKTLYGRGSFRRCAFDASIDFTSELFAKRCFTGSIPQSETFEVLTKVFDTVALTPFARLVVATIAPGIVRSCMATDAVGNRLNQRRPSAGASLGKGTFTGGVNGERVVAIDLNAVESISLRLDRKGP